MKVKGLRSLSMAVLVAAIVVAGGLGLFYGVDSMLSQESKAGEAGCAVSIKASPCTQATADTQCLEPCGAGEHEVGCGGTGCAGDLEVAPCAQAASGIEYIQPCGTGQQEVSCMKNTNTGSLDPVAGTAPGVGEQQAKSFNLPPLDINVPSETKVASFGMGCFWGSDALFGAVDGVVKTRVGYAGGTQENPSYHHIGDHTETVQVEYDPDKVSYGELLELFWANHNPSRAPWSNQYISLILFHDEQQHQAALASRERYVAEHGDVYTEIRALVEFYRAEDYHQKYHLRQDTHLMEEFGGFYPQADDFTNSTAAARVNGYLAGNGTCQDLMKELPNLGLSSGAVRIVSKKVCGQAIQYPSQDSVLREASVSDKVVKSEQEWREVLTTEQFHILREKGTEPAFTGKYTYNHDRGVYLCAGCGQPLFDSSTKFDSGTGWPSFWAPISEQSIEEKSDQALSFLPRTEVLCSRCGGHLGHVFNDGPEPTGKRFCMNSGALAFEK